MKNRLFFSFCVLFLTYGAYSQDIVQIKSKLRSYGYSLTNFNGTQGDSAVRNLAQSLGSNGTIDGDKANQVFSIITRQKNSSIFPHDALVDYAYLIGDGSKILFVQIHVGSEEKASKIAVDLKNAISTYFEPQQCLFLNKDTLTIWFDTSQRRFLPIQTYKFKSEILSNDGKVIY